jgi:hypothetical protein
MIAPCRLFVYLARQAPRAVVLRRGPTDWARLSVWDTETDRFEHGQWMRGRVYERRSDVSADGQLFAAFVRQSGGRNPAGADSWIALSRPPYFTALAVWYVGGTYHPGAFFPDDKSLWLGYMNEAPPDVGTKPASLHIAAPQPIPYVDGTGEWTERTVHFNRLLRDGWRLAGREPYATLWERPHPAARDSGLGLSRRSLSGGGDSGTHVEAMTLSMVHVLEDFSRFGGPYAVDYTITTADGREHSLGEATWADWDHRGRLVAARDGRLSEWSEARGWTLIEDFNGQEPDPQPAPGWATKV